MTRNISISEWEADQYYEYVYQEAATAAEVRDTLALSAAGWRLKFALAVTGGYALIFERALKGENDG